ncbi:DUF6574 domain-containing protein [Carnobacterium gallinarum]|uniref:DUF6574 domain-containing protein n=1 Tax=Carnobacterium gallinarum TaxID=2749 RepID=UPI0005529142|nr:DUF6574 domain-containing protein [Carnobacterium gallinarum]
MKKLCEKCGAELLPEEVKCPTCGTEVKEINIQEGSTKEKLAGNESVEMEVEEISMNQKQDVPKDTQKTTTFNSEKMKQISLDYWSFIVKTIKKPMSSYQEKNPIFGYLTICLNSILVAIMLTSFTAKTVGSLYSLGGGSSFGFVVGTFFKAFILVLIFTLVFMGIPYGVQKFIMKQNPNLPSYLTHLSGMMMPGVVLIAVGALLSLVVNVTLITTILYLLIVALMIFAIAFTISLIIPKNDSSLDRIYIITISWLGNFIIQTLIIKILLTSMFSDMSSIFSYLF